MLDFVKFYSIMLYMLIYTLKVMFFGIIFGSLFQSTIVRLQHREYFGDTYLFPLLLLAIFIVIIVLIKVLQVTK